MTSAPAPRNVLFLCTANSARSVLAEAILNRRGEGRFRAYSAGSKPRGEIHPAARRLLEQRGHPVGGLASKSWDVFARPGAPQLDLIITVCDNAANETCPVWPGRPANAHWGIPDPAGSAAGEAEEDAAFALAYRRLESGIARLVELPVETMSETALRERLAGIGRSLPGVC